MLIPRFSLRWLLSALTASGLFFLVVAQAVRGEHWAQGLCFAALCLASCLALYVVAWSAAIVLAKTLSVQPAVEAESTPFASAEPPAQIIPPEDPE